jgi:sarcosine oxidase subunit beta
MYVKPEPGGEFIVGGIDRPRIDPERGLEGVDSEHLRRIGERLEYRLPEYADAAVVDTWSGEIGVTPDSNQIVGIPRGMENFFNMVGGSGHGFKEAPAFAESVAQQILALEPRFDLSPYRLERFDERSEFEGISKETYGDH